MWTRDTARGEAIARRLEAGAVCVNDAQINYFALELPMGGWKASGLGRPPRRGRDPQVLPPAVAARHPLAPRRDIHMFPYRAGTTGLLRRLLRLLYGRGRRD